MLRRHAKNEAKRLNETYLLEYLELHKNILSKYTYDYLECLIRLDLSILKKGYITEEEMQYLMQLGLVQSIAKYNIYERAKAIVDQDASKFNLIVSSSDDKKEYLKVMGIDGEEHFCVFDYQAFNDLININLYNIIESPLNREKEINRIVRNINNLYDNQPRYQNMNGKSLQEQIREQQTIRHELMERTKLTGKKAETLNHFYTQFMINFGVPTHEFTSESPLGNNMEKTLTKKYPGIIISQNIKYY